MKSDIQIAQESKLLNIADIASGLGLPPDSVYNHGRYKAKLDHRILADLQSKKDAKLILVTAINPTPAGEGKTTTTVGLGDALSRLGHKALICLREPALGPVFGVKGGAAGGGYSQVVPMEDINLHFTGDFHAIGAANNLLAALIDNHIYQGNTLNIDPRRITWRRALDMNDRQLRSVISGLNGKANGFPREDGFDITVASEVMAIFCLSESLSELKLRLSRMVVAYTYDNEPVLAADLNAQGAMTALLKDAFNPNLAQTLEHTPAFIHGGPFANIAHGCNSVMATKLAMKLGDFVVTEAGFGADLGAEKFIDIKCRKSGLIPDAIVLVATVRALKYHGGAEKNELGCPDIGLLEKGAANIKRHISNIKNVFGLPLVVAINKFPSDSEGEIETLINICRNEGAEAFLSEVFTSGGLGGLSLAQKVVELTSGDNKKDNFAFAYDENETIRKKIKAVAVKIYGASDVAISAEAAKAIRELEKNGYGGLPICIAKTQYSFSDNPKLMGAPDNFTLNVRQIKLSAGAGFIVVITGDIMTMPGLPKQPAAENIDVDDFGIISGLF